MICFVYNICNENKITYFGGIHMKKMLTIAMVAMMALALAACTSTEPTETASPSALDPTATSTAVSSGQAHVDAIKKAGKLTVVTCADYPPYEFVDSETGEVVGVDMDVAKAIADKLGVELEVKNIQDFKGVLASLQAGYQDIAMSGFTPTDERKKSVDFSDPYSTTTNVVIVKKGNEDKYDSVEKLSKAVIGAQRGSEQEDIATDFVKADTVKTQSRIDTLLLSLSNEQIEAAIVEKAVASAYLAKLDGLAIANLDLKYGETTYCAVLNKNNDELMAIVNETISELKANDKLDEFYANAAEKMNAQKDDAE